MTNKEAIDRWAEQIIPAVFRAEDALKKAKPEWEERLKRLGEPGGEPPEVVAQEYCREVGTDWLTMTTFTGKHEFFRDDAPLDDFAACLFAEAE